MLAVAASAMLLVASKTMLICTAVGSMLYLWTLFGQWSRDFAERVPRDTLLSPSFHLQAPPPPVGLVLRKADRLHIIANFITTPVRYGAVRWRELVAQRRNDALHSKHVNAVPADIHMAKAAAGAIMTSRRSKTGPLPDSAAPAGLLRARATAAGAVSAHVAPLAMTAQVLDMDHVHLTFPQFVWGTWAHPCL